MYTPVVVMVALVAYVWQLQSCFSRKGPKRFLPAALLAGACAGLALFAMLGNELGMPSAPFGAAVFSVLLLIPLGGAVLGWMTYAIVRLVQKCRK